MTTRVSVGIVNVARVSSSTIALFATLSLLLTLINAQSNSQSSGVGQETGALISTRTEPLSQLSVAHRMLASLPSGAGETLVISCQYKTKRGSVTTSSIRRFWNAKTPSWISKVPRSHAIFSIVRGTVEECPATVAIADGASSTGLARQPKATMDNKSLTPGKLTANSFTTKGLKYETALTALYLGDSDNVRLQYDSLEFNALIRFYIDTFARRCESYLPANRVEVNLEECEAVEVTKRYGAEVSRTCVEHRKGFADPALFAAKEKEAISAANGLMSMIDPADPFRSSIGNSISADSAQSLARADMDSLFRMNTCDSPGLKRFQENLRRYATDETLLLLAEDSKPLRRVDNYRNFLEDLLKGDPSGGGYYSETVSDIIVSSRDAAGNPARITATFYFSSYTKGRTKTSLQLDFVDGIPTCLYFLEYSTDCRRPNPTVVQNYRDGKYRK